MRLEAQNLSFFSHKRTCLDKVNFVSDGFSCLGLVGPNGAGKSLLLRLLHGLLAPHQGRVLWNGERLDPTSRDIAMVFQKTVLLRRSVNENIQYALRQHCHCRKEIALRTQRALQKFSLENSAHIPAVTLSGGQQQKLAITRCWVSRPQILLMDEPTNALDANATITIEDIILSMIQENTKIVIATHNFSQVKRLCDEVLFLQKGQLICHTPKGAFFNSDDPQVRTFLRYCN